MSLPWLAVPLALATALSTTLGGLAAVRLADRLGDLIALSGGVVVAIALLDVLPEAERELGQPGRVSLLVAAGFVLFFLANRLLVLHHRDDSDQARAHHRIGTMGAGSALVDAGRGRPNCRSRRRGVARDLGSGPGSAPGSLRGLLPLPRRL